MEKFTKNDVVDLALTGIGTSLVAGYTFDKGSKFVDVCRDKNLTAKQRRKKAFKEGVKTTAGTLALSLLLFKIGTTVVSLFSKK